MEGFSSLDLSEASFSNSNGYHSSTKMTNIFFNRNHLFQIKLNSLSFHSTNFIHNNLIQCQIINCKFLDSAYLLNNSLINAIIRNSSFSSMIFDQVNLSNAYLEHNIFRNASLISCDMRGASLLGNSFYN